MDIESTKDANGGCVNNKPVAVATLDVATVKEAHAANGEDYSDSNSLLPPRRGGMSRNNGKTCSRKVQWNDNNGNKLVEVLEYEPSDVSDSEDDDDDDDDSCICSIM